MQTAPAPASPSRLAYAQRSTNTLQLVFLDHCGRFAAEYDSRYARKHGNFRVERIARVAARFLTCGDCRQGVARIRCSNPECRHDYFRPFSCKGFSLGPSCSQKRSLLFAKLSPLIFSLIAEFYSSAAGKPISAAAVIAYQPLTTRFGSTRTSTP